MDILAVAAALRGNELEFEHYVDDLRQNFMEHAVDDEPEVQGQPGPYQSIVDNANRQMLLFTFTGFELQEFTTIWLTCQNFLTTNARGRQPIISGKDALLAVLTHLKHYQHLEKQAADFRVTTQTFVRTLEKTFPRILEPLWNRFVRVIRRPELVQQNIVIQDFPNVVSMLDCTVQQCRKPTGTYNEQKIYFSGKHWMYCLKSLTVHAPNGLVMLV